MSNEVNPAEWQARSLHEMTQQIQTMMELYKESSDLQAANLQRLVENHKALAEEMSTEMKEFRETRELLEALVGALDDHLNKLVKVTAALVKLHQEQSGQVVASQ